MRHDKDVGHRNNNDQPQEEVRDRAILTRLENNQPECITGTQKRDKTCFVSVNFKIGNRILHTAAIVLAASRLLLAEGRSDMATTRQHAPWRVQPLHMVASTVTMECRAHSPENTRIHCDARGGVDGWVVRSRHEEVGNIRNGRCGVEYKKGESCVG